ncbi:unnamed protein product [Vitrella brassicaformis CCMP3155]|uniref:ribulose-phosphate 3-epimerase n=1 Tax=Vitrella brassicaformis (strain CCMP3155) TaxID=1169540 RepID=A0A0G4EKR7_VITBC|nr:unnamed protein product [Vitrella brassicaformis CCMP3155]|mmetsp:Transcript_11964/g.34678  ORF Transcript_11964/g.34678 Transcript_11964/m.34678 type:complete len:318 (+) Transcript_11964:106-1059(+)|eukprot:CEL97044.1 unnamed protein product [Vitrella brassicaformis CCMP3155]
MIRAFAISLALLAAIAAADDDTLSLLVVVPSLEASEGFVTAPTRCSPASSMAQTNRLRRGRTHHTQLRMAVDDGYPHTDGFTIAPSILSANFAKLGEEVDNVLVSGADTVHFDVMDNHYVPNLTIGPLVCDALRKHGVTAPIDVHLMVTPVDQLVGDFIKAGASYITFHPEASHHPDRTLSVIKDAGLKAGLVFNPATPLDWLKYAIDKVDIVLLMSVNPGFGGQKFIGYTLDKLREAREIIDKSGRSIRLEIDGGVGPANIREVAQSGADMFVAGSAIFGTPDYKETIDKMRAELAAADVKPSWLERAKQGELVAV